MCSNKPLIKMLHLFIFLSDVEGQLRTGRAKTRNVKNYSSVYKFSRKHVLFCVKVSKFLPTNRNFEIMFTKIIERTSAILCSICFIIIDSNNLLGDMI